MDLEATYYAVTRWSLGSVGPIGVTEGRARIVSDIDSKNSDTLVAHCSLSTGRTAAVSIYF